MAEPRLEKSQHSPKRVFVSNINSYSCKCIAKVLSECMIREPEAEPEAEEEETLTSNQSREPVPAFHVVGTVSERRHEDRPYVLEEYVHLSKDDLLSKLMACDIIIYDINHQPAPLEEALWAVSELHNQMGHFTGPKMFILISTVMTWANTKPPDPDADLPLTDEMFWGRRAHPNFKQHIDLEKRTVKFGKTNQAMLSTYVVASGLQYGMEEQILHFFFKTSWLGLEDEIPVFGNGKNIIPLIHINDLASVIENVIEYQPKAYYLLAVDQSNNTMEDIVKSISSVLGPGKIQKKPMEEAFLIRDLSVKEIDCLTINLRMEGVYVKAMSSINWLCKSGLVENIELVVEEYRQARALLPIRLCVLGPPAVGKSTLSRQICERYKLHHITVKKTISETIKELENTVRNPDSDAENEDSVAEAQTLLNSLKEGIEQSEDLLDDQLLMKIMKDKLMSNACRNQGFVLDGFPKTYEQARELFSVEEHQSEDEAILSSPYSKSILPELVLSLDASDAFLRNRVMDLPERVVQEHCYEQDRFLQQLAIYRKSLMEDEIVVGYFHELDITPLYFEITSSDEPECLLLMQKIYDTVGPPRNYGPSIQELEEEERMRVEEQMKREAEEKAEEERGEREEAANRAAHLEEWTRRLEDVRQQEETLLEAESESVRSYLMEHVMPTLNQGLVECCMAQPQDPVDFLAKYLMENNPFNY